MKTRFDGLDVLAMVAHLQRTLLGSKVVNIYNLQQQKQQKQQQQQQEGSATEDAYILKLDTSSASINQSNNQGNNHNNAGSKKSFLLLQSGIRFHDVVTETTTTTDHNNNGPNNITASSSMLDFSGTMPTPFCSKLRKHLRGLRLEQVQQVGTDRVVVFHFLGHSSSSSNSNSNSTAADTDTDNNNNGGATKMALILELYSKGNLILANAAQDYRILALLRSHVYNNNSNNNKTAGSPLVDGCRSLQPLVIDIGRSAPTTTQ
mmetsp:Transcript_5410/g.15237  ORF Transcript_5410/g.15237 Transcript_5410/m.15237 type:complete len:262 (+) Transcript_5410:84-869(+)